MKLRMAVVSVLVLGSWPAEAQVERRQPALLLAQAERRAADVSDPAAGTAPEAGPIIVPRLNGLVLTESMSQITTNGRPEIRGLEVVGPRFLQNQKGLEKVVAPYLLQPLRWGELERLQREIVLFCRKVDHPIVDVFMPVKLSTNVDAPTVSLTNGVVQMAVIEGRVGRIAVMDGNKPRVVYHTNILGQIDQTNIVYEPYTNGWYSERFVLRNVRIRPGDAVLDSRLKEDLNWLNRAPFFRDVSAAFSQGTSYGQTDLELRVRDGKEALKPWPLVVSAGYEDSSPKLLGDHRVLGGLAWGNVTGLGDQLDYQFACDPEARLLRSHVATYNGPLPWPWRSTVTLFGYYAEAKPDMAAIGLPDFNLQGTSYQVSGRYAVPVPIRVGRYEHGLSVGLDYKRANNYLEFGGTTLYRTPISVMQVVAGYNGRLLDTMGETAISAQGFYSPGGLSAFNSDTDYWIARAGAKANYCYLRVTGERTTSLTSPEWLKLHDPDDCFKHVLSATWQYADQKLLPSEQVNVGGYATVRGYDERVASGDMGWIVRNELITPVWKTRIGTWPVKLWLLGFFDYGSVNVSLSKPVQWYEAQEAKDPHTDLMSVGCGLRILVRRNFELRFDYGFQLTDDAALRSKLGASADRSRAHIGAVVRF